MAKLEGFTKMAVINYGGYTDYYFAIYDDGTDYQVGDLVVFSGLSKPARIKEIVDASEAMEKCKKNIIAEVIGKVDTSAYDERVAMRKKKADLRKAMDKRKKELQMTLDDMYYAERDADYAELLKEYQNL